MKREFKAATDEQDEVCQREALEAVAKVLDDADLFDGSALRQDLSWASFRQAMDRAWEACGKAEEDFEKREGLDYVSLDKKEIIASAVFAFMSDLDTKDVHPRCVGGSIYLAFGQWMICRELAVQLEMAEEDGCDILQGSSETVSPESP